MSRISFGFFLLVLLFVETSPPACAETAPRSVSNSRQFIVYGSDARLRGAISDLAEQTKATALRLLHENDAWKTCIVIDAQLPQANLPELPPARLHFSQTGFGLKLQLDLTIGADARARAIERALLRAIYLEMIYRDRPETPAGTVLVEPPDWLLDGTLTLASDRAVAAAADCLRTISDTGHVIALADFLEQRPALLDSTSQTIYRAYSAALVSAITETSDDRRRLARFLAELPRASNDALAEFRAHFPAFAGDSTERMWNRAVAHWSLADRIRMLDCAGTERQLTQTLRVDVKQGDQSRQSFTLEEFPKFAALADAPAALATMNRELMLLSSRAHPLFLPVIFEYEKIADRIAHRKTKRIARRLAEVRAAREAIGRTMEKIGDYLNWFEATQAHTSSGGFRDYLKTAEQAEAPEPRRHDPISVYLDSIESLLPR